MNVWDGRHRWGPVVRDGLFIRRTCSACGRTDSYETLIPDVFVDELVRNFTKPNSYRALLVRQGIDL